MTERPIQRLPDPKRASRLKGGRPPPPPKGRGRGRQRERFHADMERLDQAISGPDASIALRQDPNGIAPERALVFVTAAPIQNFNRVAKEIGLEVLSEAEDDGLVMPEDLLEPDGGAARPTFYATMPSLQVFRRMLSLWKAYQRGEGAPNGSAPWWQLFELLAELRPWGPMDRLGEAARRELGGLLLDDPNLEIRLELEVWPTRSADKRDVWKTDVRAMIAAQGGRVISSCTIGETGFVYDAILAGLPAPVVRQLLDNPDDPECLGSLDGLQHILPQTVGQSIPDSSDATEPSEDEVEAFDETSPFKALLLDGTPIAGHVQLDGGVMVEDVHDLDPLSLVVNRRHATSMASLILRGDLQADGEPISDCRIIAMPLLIDSESDAHSPPDRLFIDLVHIGLLRAFEGEDPLAPDAFVVNFSIGIRGAGFVRSVSSLARLLDWWSEKAGVLFMISAGNIGHDLWVPDISTAEFEGLENDERRRKICELLTVEKADRALLAPAEAMNGVTVGAVSDDLSDPDFDAPAGEIDFCGDGQVAVSSAIGLGALRSVKPDIVEIGGAHNIRVLPSGNDARIRVVSTNRTGLKVASSTSGINGTKKERGTSCANALATRSAIKCVSSLTSEGGPFDGQALPRMDAALLAKCLLVGSSSWPKAAVDLFEDLKEQGGYVGHHKDEVARFYGHGLVDQARLLEAPSNGATLVGLGTLRKDQADVFEVPLPPSMAGQKLPRSMIVTLAWFSPVEPARARYRLAALEAVAANGIGDDAVKDPNWFWSMKGDGIDHNQIRRGTVWSKRMIQKNAHVPDYADDAILPIRVQCRDTSSGGLSPDDDIRFAISVTLETEVETQFDIHEEIRERLQVGVTAGG